MTETFFIAQPVATGKKSKKDSSGHTFPLYRSGALTLKWSNEKEPPAIGQEITITMNGIGPAIVKGYFASGDYLGVMTFATNPPAWLKKQSSPNLEQLKAIHAWAKLHGPFWKEKLRRAWMTVNYRGFADGHLLQQVRNQFGPAWLADYTPEPRHLTKPAWWYEGIGCEFGAEIDY